MNLMNTKYSCYMGKMIILKYLITPDMCCIRCPYPRLCRQKASINISNGPSREHLMVMKALQQVLEMSRKIDLRIRDPEEKIYRKITP
ncbi:hypothetical protein OUZ56_012763 [Daphnia magna]|uniref:Uncharacterized protein n=1 Tax=Daphnia magna TaxID=35525 RepID=A0ABQ9Z3Z9_9CRUS|nr:hypothetical protein OUZ56_012763 [Daphnia magna]